METNNLKSKKKVEINKMKLISKYEKLRNDYFLRKVFYNLDKKKSLKIAKYNKKIQGRMNINNNDYKEYAKKYSSIEIEIIPVKNKYVKFINIKDKDEKYYHIYFNNKEEIKRNFINENEKINMIKIIIDNQINSFEKLFMFCDCIESIYFKQFYRNNIINMKSMFFGCSSLKDLNLNYFKTNNVTDMSFMFYGCFSLKELNLNNFNTKKVNNMSYMFSDCSSLKALNLNNFNTNNVTDMSEMFYNCSSLNELNISNFNTNKVANMSSMFSRCSGLRMLNVSNFNTNNVTDMSYMFFNCLRLQDLNLDNFNTNNVTDMSNMFEYCTDEFQKKIKSKYNNLKDEAFRV